MVRRHPPGSMKSGGPRLSATSAFRAPTRRSGTAPSSAPGCIDLTLPDASKNTQLGSLPKSCPSRSSHVKLCDQRCPKHHSSSDVSTETLKGLPIAWTTSCSVEPSAISSNLWGENLAETRVFGRSCQAKQISARASAEAARPATTQNPRLTESSCSVAIPAADRTREGMAWGMEEFRASRHN